MADDKNRHDDDLVDSDDNEDMDFLDDQEEDLEDDFFDDDIDEDDEDSEEDEQLDALSEKIALATTSDEAGSRLDLTDIHGGTLKPTDLSSEMKTSFLEYSMSVIVARALPDVRDGLKPVHRRILYAMNEAHIVPSRPHKKSAWAVGEVIGKYHPHGDSAVYDAMVRLAQDFSMRLPLVDGHGNFGSIDGDPPAAMRYTEARLARSAMELLRDLDKETVDLQPNYDESLTEPSVLPARFPNLLVNGSSGIAVGMSTNIPPHNLGEVVAATKMLIDNPDATVQDLMSVLPGPDFPTGGIIMGEDGIKKAYETGRGSVVVRAKCKIENFGRGRQRIVVTEIPYQVNKGTLQERIAQLVNEKRIEGISDMRDESNRKGMRLIFELKQGAMPQVVLNNLYKKSQLQNTFGVISLALVNGVPKTLTLKQMIQYYIDHQVDVVTRRTEYDLRKARKEVHLLEGLLIAVDNIDEVVQIIKTSKDDDESKQRLHERFGLDKVQCEAILQMRLRRLTGLARQKLVDQINELHERIAYLEDLLSSRDKILSVIKDELQEICDKYDTPRRTKISNAAVDIDVEDLIAEEDMVVTITHTDYVKRLSVGTYRSQRRGGKGVQGINLKDGDFVEELFIASTHDYVLFFSNKGKVYKLKVHELPEGSRTSRGTAAVNFLPLEEGERIAAVITCPSFPETECLLFATRDGMVKKTPMSDYNRSRRDGIIAINLKDDDELVAVRRVKKGMKVILTTDEGKTILFDESEARTMGRGTMGVKGITLKDGAKVLGMETSNGNGDLFVITEKGYGKRTPVSEYPEHKRGGQGVMTLAMTKKKGLIAGMKVVGPQHELMIVSEEGTVIRVKAKDISLLGRATQGVKVMNVDENDAVCAIARMVAKKKKAPKKDPNQGVLDLAAAGGHEEEEDPIDIGDDEMIDDTLLDDEDE